MQQTMIRELGMARTTGSEPTTRQVMLKLQRKSESASVDISYV